MHDPALDCLLDGHGFLLEWRGFGNLRYIVFGQESLARFFLVIAWCVQPRVAFQLLNGVPLGSIVGEKVGNEVLEIGREILPVDFLKVNLHLTSN